MHTLDEKGGLLIPLVLVIVLLLGALGFGAWAFSGRQDYKNNVDSKIAAAVETANEKLSVEKEAEFAEREKSPSKSYQGPTALGAINIVYPKTWSAYVVESEGGNIVLSGYFHPGFVHDVRSDSSFAFRLEIVNDTYDAVIKTFDSKVKSGKVSVAAYRAPKVEASLGAMLTGDITSKKQGTLVLLPLRDKTIRLWTEGQDYKGDFDAILKELTFNQ